MWKYKKRMEQYELYNDLIKLDGVFEVSIAHSVVNPIIFIIHVENNALIHDEINDIKEKCADKKIKFDFIYH